MASRLQQLSLEAAEAVEAAGEALDVAVGGRSQITLTRQDKVSRQGVMEMSKVCRFSLYYSKAISSLMQSYIPQVL